MSDLQPPQPAPPPAPHTTSAMTRLRNYFLTGLVIAAPVFITIWLTWTFIQWVDDWIEPLIPPRYWPDTYLPFAVPGFGLIVVLFSITMFGFLAANLVGRSLIRSGEALVDRMPFVRTVYSALKQIFETVLSSQQKSFQKVGLIEYPREGLWALVLISTDAKGEIRTKITPEGEEVLSVFLPTTPNPTSGFLLFVKAADLIPLEMSVEDAAKLIISAGLVVPDLPSADRPKGSRGRRAAGQTAAPKQPETVNQP